MDIKSVTKTNPYAVSATQETKKDQAQDGNQYPGGKSSQTPEEAAASAEASSKQSTNEPSRDLLTPLLGTEKVIELLKHRPKPSVLQILVKLKWASKKQENPPRLK